MSTQSLEDRSYNELGLLSGTDRGSGSGPSEVRTYDDFNRVKTITNTHLETAEYDYDKNHNKLEEKWSAGSPLFKWGFYTSDTGGYDKEDRFLKFQYYDSDPRSLSWSRDNVGNIGTIQQLSLIHI